MKTRILLRASDKALRNLGIEGREHVLEGDYRRHDGAAYDARRSDAHEVTGPLSCVGPHHHPIDTPADATVHVDLHYKYEDIDNDLEAYIDMLGRAQIPYKARQVNGGWEVTVSTGVQSYAAFDEIGRLLSVEGRITPGV